MESNLEPCLYSVPHGARNKDASRWRFCLKASSHVYIVTINVVPLDDDIAKVKAGPEYDGFIFGLATSGLYHGLLKINCRSERVHGAGKLDQSTVAFEPDHAPTVAHDRRLKP